MSKKTRNHVIVDIETARELVEPHVLEDVLRSLVDNGILVRWQVTKENLVLQPKDGRRVDLAFLLTDATAAASTDRGRKRAA